MTIAIDGRSLQGAWGGVDVYAYQLLTHLFTHHSEHSYILFFNCNKAFQHPFAHYACVQIIHTRIPSKVFNFFLMVFRFPKLDVYLEAASGRTIDIFFMPNLNFAAFSSKARTVLTIHDLSFIHYPWYQTRRSRWWHASLRSKELIDRSDRILSVSDSTKRDIVSTFHVDSAKVRTIPLGVDNYSNTGHSSQQLPIILAFCPQEGRKNIEALIEAFSHARHTDIRMQSAYLVIAGISAMPRRIQHAIRRHTISQWVRCVPYVARERQYALMKSARVCAYPSIYEGFGLPPLEALMAGVPVIAGAHSSIPEVSGSGVWLCDPYNIAELSDGLVKLFTDDILRNFLIDKGKAIAESYQWNTTASQTIHEFESVCA